MVIIVYHPYIFLNQGIIVRALKAHTGYQFKLIIISIDLHSPYIMNISIDGHSMHTEEISIILHLESLD